MAMSAKHKEALAQGRREASAIKKYLGALGRRRPGRPVTPESLKKRVADLSGRLSSEQDALRAVELRQQIIEAEKTLAEADTAASVDELEKGFVEHAASYSDRKRISYAAWRQSGVPAQVLKKAGVRR
ncbi:MAG: hypothetical protein WEA29_08035 [Acidimicrobiia bacterium]